MTSCFQEVYQFILSSRTCENAYFLISLQSFNFAHSDEWIFVYHCALIWISLVTSKFMGNSCDVLVKSLYLSHLADSLEKLTFKSSLYILDMGPLWDLHVANIFTLSLLFYYNNGIF